MDKRQVDVQSRPTTDLEHWQILNRRLLLDRSPYVRILEHDVKLPGGEIIYGWVDVEICSFAMTFVLTDDGRVPFVRQYRQSIMDYMLELPAGHLDDGEDPLVAAQRELREETGLEASDWRFLGKYVMDSNRGCGWGYMYLARNARPVAVPQPGDVGEMTLHMLTLAEARRLWSGGELVSAPTSLCIGLALNVLSGSVDQ